MVVNLTKETMPTLSNELSQLRAKSASIKKSLGVDDYLLYATSTRQSPLPVGGNVATDVIPYIDIQLRKMGKKKKLALIIHTNGGELSAPWPIISLIREYCDELTVVVVDRALSAGTLIAIGADKIVMAPNSFLSPVDPQANVAINGQQKNVEVEDVTGYIEFVKTRTGLTAGAGLEKAFESLTNEIPPTVIGSLYRTHALIRSLAQKLLNLRRKKLDSSAEKMVIENLTEKLFSHNHLISRAEAKNQVGLGDTIIMASGELLSGVEALSDEISKTFKLTETLNPELSLSQQPTHKESIYNAVLLSAESVAAFKSELLIARAPDGNVSVNVNSIGWVKE